MAKTDFTFVGQPHDPRSISGSDPYNAMATSGQEKPNTIGTARLAFWYKFDPGCVQTATHWYHQRTAASMSFPVDGANGWRYRNRAPIEKIYDVSGNSKVFHGFNNRAAVVGSSHAGKDQMQRHLYFTGNDWNDGLLTGSRDNNSIAANYRVTGDDQSFLIGHHGTARHVAYQSGYAARSFEIDGGTENWVTGSHSTDGTNQTVSDSMDGGFSLFSTMRYNADESGQGANHEDDKTFPIYVSYPGHLASTDSDNNEHDCFSIGLTHDGGGSYRTMEMTHREADNGGTVVTRGSTTDLADTWHVLSMTYDNQTNKDLKVTSSMYVAGQEEAVLKYSYNNANSPQNQAGRKSSIGGDSWAGGGDIHADLVINPGSTAESHLVNGWHEFFAFDDTLSNIRRQQMERYLSDRLELAMSASDYLPQFDGGATGVTYAHSSLSNALSGQGTACRRYIMQNTGSGQVGPLKLHEVGGGAFVKSSVDSSAYCRPKSTAAIQMEMWVRAESTNDSREGGSQVALVAKASSPFGHQMDNIKGYALKFGTLQDGAKSGNVPKFRLSLRNSDEWLDGTTTGGCSDITFTPSGFTPAADVWYQMKMEIIPAGFNFDKIRVYAKANGGSYEELGDSPYYVYNDGSNYRTWWDDNLDEHPHMRAPNGTHCGYWVAMSSSVGQRLNTAYYIDSFSIKTDTVL